MIDHDPGIPGIASLLKQPFDSRAVEDFGNLGIARQEAD
jgi:hypothetical protein